VDIDIVEFLAKMTITFTAEADDFLHKKDIFWYLGVLKDKKKRKRKLTKNEKGNFGEVRWFDLEEAIELIPFEDEKEIVKKLILKVIK